MKQKSDGALKGFKVIDLSRVLAGPFCTQILGDHGAEIVKIEPPVGDETRTWGPFGPNGSAYYSGINRNKRHAAVDFSKQEGRDLLLRMLEGADVLIHNFKAGTLERWGLGYEGILASKFPRLIYCQITGFGEDGPLGGLPGYDSVVQAIAGNMSVNGSEDSGPLRVGMSIVDIGTGMNALAAILMAALERERSGLGQKLDVCLYDCALAYLHPHAAGYLQTGAAPVRSGNQHPSIAPYEEFATKTGPMFLGAGNNGQFVAACKMLGCSELTTDPRFATNALRVQNREELHGFLQAVLAKFDGEELASRLLRSGIPASAIKDVPSVLAAPHTHHRKMILEKGEYKALGIPIKMSRTPGSLRSTPKTLGADTREICREAGLSDVEIDRMVAERTVLEAPLPISKS
ncbi:CaiB/BaiF CoA transferase family protein [Tardiphaga sp. 367_B4_N1_1]|jgi:crotonobetainyl-CoA:carnitine CoA-transferase CaiB-like acyl-CoA transferase|uniref:CaiB/BaiF CoA transferase family protein n=1 Tax=Tardiphaga sp. 367_B4_N1_1 TaxID=3240777 RepID=UPI003F200D8F